jgi:hypothetical protein
MSPGVVYCAQKAAENETLAAGATDALIRKQFETLAEFWLGAAYWYQWNEDTEAEIQLQSLCAKLAYYSNLSGQQNIGLLDA